MAGLSKIMQLASEFADNQVLSPKKRAELLAYLHDVAGDTARKDMWPGAADPTWLNQVRPPQALKGPDPTETWYRGGPSHLRLNDPVFLTRDPAGAAWYAVDRSKTGLGAVGEYQTNAKNPARLRDLFQVGLEEPDALESLPYDTGNLLDYAYGDAMRQALRDRGFDSLLGSDVLERGVIEALVPLSRELVLPKSRSLVTYEGHPVTNRVPSELFKDTRYLQIGPTKPFTRKAEGGLACLSPQ